MNLLIPAISIWVFAIIAFSFFNYKVSVALYVSYLILVPYLQIHISFLSLSYNAINSALLGVFIYNYYNSENRSFNFTILKPFLFLYFALLVLSLFTWGMPWSVQFNYWRASFMQTTILSFIIWNLSEKDKKSITYIKWALIISITIAGIYGLFLTQMEGINPYTSYLSDIYGIKDAAEIYSSSLSRLNFSTAGKIQATMDHPMKWSLVLCFSAISFTILFVKTKKKIYLPILGLISFNILISGVRTGIAALIIGYIYFLIRVRRFNLIIVTLILVFLSFVIIQSNKDLSNIFRSFVDVSGQKSDVHGSSIAMRLDQLQGAWDEIKDHKLTGKGYGWTGYYESLFGDHPVLLAFESLIFVVLCNSGILGVFIWIIFFLLLFFVHRKLIKENIDIYLMDTLIVTYAAYAIGTGEYGYLPFFSLFYAFQLSFLMCGASIFLNSSKKETNLN